MVGVKYVFWKRLSQASCCLQFFLFLSLDYSTHAKSAMCEIPTIHTALWNLGFSSGIPGVSNMQSASFSVPCLPQAESYLSDHFGINLFWRDTRQLPVNSRMIVAFSP